MVVIKNLKFEGIDLSVPQKVRKQGKLFWHERTLKILVLILTFDLIIRTNPVK